MVRCLAETQLDATTGDHRNHLAAALPHYSRDLHMGFFPDSEREAPMEHRHSFRDQLGRQPDLYPHSIRDEESASSFPRHHHRSCKSYLGDGHHLASFQMGCIASSPVLGLGLDRHCPATDDHPNEQTVMNRHP